MAETTTIARPYARAAFELARDKGQLKGWADALRLAAVIALDEQVRPLLDDPKVSDEHLVDLFIQVGGDAFATEVRNFIELLAENGRLIALPAIAELYDALRAEAEGSVEASVVSATPLDEAQQTKIAEALKKRFGCDVSLTYAVDESLIGGVVIRAGDLVIDGSVRSKLGKMATALRQ